MKEKIKISKDMVDAGAEYLEEQMERLGEDEHSMLYARMHHYFSHALERALSRIE